MYAIIDPPAFKMLVNIIRPQAQSIIAPSGGKLHTYLCGVFLPISLILTKQTVQHYTTQRQLQCSFIYSWTLNKPNEVVYKVEHIWTRHLCMVQTNVDYKHDLTEKVNLETFHSCYHCTLVQLLYLIFEASLLPYCLLRRYLIRPFSSNLVKI